MSKCLHQLLLSIRPWSAGGHDSSVEACDYRLCVFGNRDGPVFCLSAALAGGAGVMLSSCFSSSTWVWLPSLVSLPAISLSPYLAFSLFSLSLSVHFSLSHWHWALLPSLTIWASPPRKCVCVGVSVCACVHMQTGMCEREFEFLLERAYMCMSMFVCLGMCVCLCLRLRLCACLCLCVCVSRRVFLRQVDSCYLVALQPSQQSQGEWAGGLNPLYPKNNAEHGQHTSVCVCVCVSTDTSYLCISVCSRYRHVNTQVWKFFFVLMRVYMSWPVYKVRSKTYQTIPAANDQSAGQ